MRKIKAILRPPDGADGRTLALHRLWTAAGITGMGVCVGLLSLLAAAYSYGKLTGWAIFASYFLTPLVGAVNLLGPVLLIWLFYFLTGRAWAGFLGSFLPTMALTLVNYYKIRLRGDPLLATDLRLAAEAGGIVGHYTLELTWIIWLTLACLLVGLAGARLLFPVLLKGWKKRLGGAVCALLALAAAMTGVFLNPAVYARTTNNRFINQWSDVEVFVSRGCIYPFLYSMREMFPTPPAGYDEEQAQALLASYSDGDIPQNRAVNVVGIMLEAYCDLRDFPLLAGQPGVQQVYEPWSALEAQSVHGDLLTNIFAGGTVDSEWAFLTGYTSHGDFRKNTDSYVWYFRQQGYDTIFHHPGHSWFYNRNNVNQYLGFGRSWFTENHYGAFVDPTAAIWNSDEILVDQILADLNDRLSEGKPAFSFSVSYQNHGPYETTYTAGEAYLTPEATGMSQESCNIFNNYLNSVSSTLAAVTRLSQTLEEMTEPVVLVLFGDHKPWGGNGNTAYDEAGADFSISSLDSLYQYYSTPYLLWANSAARAQLGGEWAGEGGDFSPCFLMNELFRQCGWEGPGFMQLANQLREITPMVHSQGLYLWQGQLTDALPQTQADFLGQFLWAQYYREQKVVPVSQ
ncbi:MAG: LTA synthase family protein [Clostridium sp.]|nr:LTA synthase family protein [Clostridium sp.]